MNKKIKTLFLSIISILIIIISALSPLSQTRTSYADDNIWSWIACRYAAPLYERLSTDITAYQIKSKSVYGARQESSDMMNSFMSAGGYKFGSDKGNVFDRYGFIGTSFSGYGGEWKYFEINACSNEPKMKTDDYGRYYKDRREPQETYSNTSISLDPRVQAYEHNWITPVLDNMVLILANWVFAIAKLIVAITLTIVGMSFSDVTSMVGLGPNFQSTMFKNLYAGFFSPMLSLAFLATTVYVFWYGLLKRQIRRALVNGLGMSILCLFITSVIFFQPKALQIPLKVVNTVQALIVSVLQSPDKTDGNEICVDQSYEELPDVASDDYMEKLIAKMRSVVGCRIYKNLVFDPWMKGQFGEDVKYEDLVSIGTNEEAQSWIKDPEVKFDGGSIKNWAVFQIDVQSDTHKPVDGIRSPLINGVDKDFYRIVDAISNVKFEKHKLTSEEIGILNFGTGGGSDELGGSAGGQDPNIAKLIQEYGPEIKEVADENNVYASLILAQLVAESGFGQNSGSADCWVPMGVKTGGPNTYLGRKYPSAKLRTQEEENGQMVTIYDDFVCVKKDDYKEAAQVWLDFMRHGSAYRAEAVKAVNKHDTPTVEDAIVAIKEKVHYATSSVYIEHLNNAIKTYNLKEWDTPDDPSAPNAYDYEAFLKDPEQCRYNGMTCADGSGGGTQGGGGGEGESGSGGSGKNPFIYRSDGDSYLYTPTTTEPTKYWANWAHGYGNKLKMSASSLLINLIVCYPICYFAVFCAMYTVTISILVSMSPIFLLFGCWAGKGQEILRKYLQLIYQQAIKKIVYALLMVLTIIFVSTVIDKMEHFGYLKSIAIIILITSVLRASKTPLLNMIESKASGFGAALTPRNLVKKSFRRTVTPVVSFGAITAGALAGAEKTNSDKVSALKSAYRSQFINKLYTIRGASKIIATNKALSSNRGETDVAKRCIYCSKIILPGEVYYLNEDMNPVCSLCGDMYKEDSWIEMKNKINNNKFNRDAYISSVDLYRDICIEDGKDRGKIDTNKLSKKAREMQIKFEESLSYKDNEINWNIKLPEAIIPFVELDVFDRACIDRDRNALLSQYNAGWRGFLQGNIDANNIAGVNPRETTANNHKDIVNSSIEEYKSINNDFSTSKLIANSKARNKRQKDNIKQAKKNLSTTKKTRKEEIRQTKKITKISKEEQKKLYKDMIRTIKDSDNYRDSSAFGRFKQIYNNKDLKEQKEFMRDFKKEAKDKLETANRIRRSDYNEQKDKIAEQKRTMKNSKKGKNKKRFS